MFGEYIRRAGTPAYTPAPHRRRSSARRRCPAAGRWATCSSSRSRSCSTCATGRRCATRRSTRCRDRSRKLHVLEEARHVSFAKTYLAEVVADARPTTERAEAAAVAPIAVEVVADLMVERRRVRDARHRRRRRDRPGEPAPPGAASSATSPSSSTSSPSSASSTPPTAVNGSAAASRPDRSSPTAISTSTAHAATERASSQDASLATSVALSSKSCPPGVSDLPA